MAPKTPLEKTINLHLNICVRGNNDQRAQYIPQLVMNLDQYLDKIHNTAHDEVREAIKGMCLALLTVPVKTPREDLYMVIDAYLRDNASQWFSPKYFDDIMWNRFSCDMLRAKVALQDGIKGHAYAAATPNGAKRMSEAFTVILDICMRIADHYGIYTYLERTSELSPNFAGDV